MQLDQLLLRCYAEQQGGLWVGVCIDLNLAAQAESFDEVREKLHCQIFDYIYDAIEGEDKKHVEYLLRRKAPLSQRMKYNWINIRNKYLFLKNHALSVFSEPLPLTLRERSAC